ncbi:ComF family protein [Aquisalimonas lutea]|uniref:ComF family protein n=1 Tax=Aquisalimonas lutea TaxID=1327750 RepID=UPI0025B3ED77|nr:ComF family protein [Aquisalimonas lutea]MDN3516201.1 ComF family protein [Aquisalimonas lutea]
MEQAAKAIRRLQALLPACCLCCGQTGLGTLDLCAGCYRDLPRNRFPCRHCALPVPPGQPDCARCQRRPPPFRSLLAPWLYDEPLDGLIQGLKYHGQLPAGRVLGTILARQIGRTGAAADVLIPMPLHPRRLRERGFNQATEIARGIAAHRGIPLGDRCLRRVRETAPQSGLGRDERRRNMRGAFRAAPAVAGKRVALVDDVVTTGSSTEEAARVLLRAGAREVVAWTVARASLRG